MFGFKHLIQRLIAIPVDTATVDNAKHLVGHRHSGLQNNHALRAAVIHLHLNVGNWLTAGGGGGVGFGELAFHVAITIGNISTILVEKEVNGVYGIFVVFTKNESAGITGVLCLGGGRHRDGEAHIALIPILLGAVIVDSGLLLAAYQRCAGKDCKE